MRSTGFPVGAFLALGFVVASPLQADAGRLVFEAESGEFEDAAAEYTAIWKEDGERIIEALERRSGLKFEAGPVQVIVFEGISSSGFRHIPMRMRASYPLETKRGTLVHEMSHRLVSDYVRKDDEDHPLIFLFLYDVWVDLWGQEFADNQVAVESQRRGVYDYESAWNEALALGAEGRAKAWQDLLPEPK